jgi:NADPH-dependent curcumin reductase CurA
VPELVDGEALVAQEYLGIDATIRTWISDARSYFPPVELGEVVRSAGAGVVVASRCATLPVGTRLSTLGGWQHLAVVRDDGLVTPVPEGAPLVWVLGVLGSTGMAAYWGMTDVGRPEAGQTVVVSAAAGATGSVAGQIARLAGCRVVGIAGGQDKCRWVVDELGFDACVDHRSADFAADLRAATPNRVDVYFDNVGGPVLDTVLRRLAHRGRVVLCGAISVYNDDHRPPGPANYLELITARGRMEGFNAFDYWGRYAEATDQLRAWLESGELVHREHVFEGLDEAPNALRALFTGENRGKVVVRV